jgi:hypothetical protein
MNCSEEIYVQPLVRNSLALTFFHDRIGPNREHWRISAFLAYIDEQR